ncbi:MAG: aldo/keto reductase [Defluviitaleaceae bacterium]|nr:aldo/keto reductase [Defluviitaleaceae bacterium]
MIYKKFGGNGENVSALGFGAMRLPMIKVGEEDFVDEDKAVSVMQKAFDLGVNYVDTAPGYCNKKSEAAVGKAIKGRRDNILLSTKNPISNNSGDDWLKRLEGSLQNLETDYIDYYHFWGIGLEAFKSWQGLEFGPIEAALKAKEEGMIKHISFSYHDAPENFKPIADSGIFDSVLMQYNMLDRSNEENFAYACVKGLGTVAMGPVGGGNLGSPSDVIQSILGVKTKSTAEMALRFVLSNENVHIALSGMNTMEMVNENVSVASRAGQLTPDEKQRLNEMMDKYKKFAELYCTGCDYCKPCPQGIEIGYLFKLMNQHRVYGLTDVARGAYSGVVNGWSWIKSADASKCTACGECEKKCPQKLPIIEQLKETHTALS